MFLDPKNPLRVFSIKEWYDLVKPPESVLSYAFVSCGEESGKLFYYLPNERDDVSKEKYLEYCRAVGALGSEPGILNFTEENVPTYWNF